MNSRKEVEVNGFDYHDYAELRRRAAELQSEAICNALGRLFAAVRGLFHGPRAAAGKGKLIHH